MMNVMVHRISLWAQQLEREGERDKADLLYSCADEIIWTRGEMRKLKDTLPAPTWAAPAE